MTSKLIVGFAVAVLATFLMPVSEALAICCGSSCCRIEGVCHTLGELNPDNACEVCDPAASQIAWSAVPDCPAESDAGPPAEDAGMTEEDAGTSTTDAGTASDAGSPTGNDGGPTGGSDSGPVVGTDAGSGSDSGSDDGGCSAAGSGAFGGLFSLLLLGLRRRKATAL